MWLGHLGPGVIRGRLRLVSPFVCSSASCSSASVVLWMFCRPLSVIYVLSLSGLRFVVPLSVFVFASSLSLSLSSLCLLFFSLLVLTCLVQSFLVLVLSCLGLRLCLGLGLVLSCLVCSLCPLEGRLGSFFVVLRVFQGNFWSSWGSFWALGMVLGRSWGILVRSWGQLTARRQ